MEEQNKVIKWIVSGGVLLVVGVSGATYALTRTPTDAGTTASPVAVAQPTTSANADHNSTPPTRTARKAITQPKVNATKFPIWKTIKLGTGLKTADDVRNALKQNGVWLGPGVSEMLDNPSFIVSATETEVDLVDVSVAELGFKDQASLNDIYRTANASGLELCPPEVGPQLRLQYMDQPVDGGLQIAMEPITNFHLGTRSFYLNKSSTASGLLTLGGSLLALDNPNFLFNTDRRFIFVRPK